jgi:excinuclease ABC subunit A
MPCPACNGARYNAATLEIVQRGKNIAEVLGLAVDAAFEFLLEEHSLRHSLSVLREVGLVDSGNTVIVVEHDMRVAASSDWIVDLGPGAGDEGGRVVAQGRPLQVARSKASKTAPYLAALLAPPSNTPQRTRP